MGILIYLTLNLICYQVECKRAQAKDIMQNAGKKGMKHGGGGSGRDQSSHQSSHRHGGGVKNLITCIVNYFL
jgi:hypothetical protein